MISILCTLTGLNDIVPDNLLSMFDENELEVCVRNSKSLLRNLIRGLLSLSLSLSLSLPSLLPLSLPFSLPLPPSLSLYSL